MGERVLLDEHLRVTAEFLEGLDDTDVVERLLAILHDKRDRANPLILFHPLLLLRLHRLQANGPQFHGRLALAVRARHPEIWKDVERLLRQMAPPPPVGTNGAAPQIITAYELLKKDLPALVYVVESVLPAGTTLLVGKSKDGKSLMAYNIALAVAGGGKALGRYDVTQGKVWYLALEDGERRAKKRIEAQKDRYHINDAALQAVHMILWDAPRLTQGLEETLVEWMQQPEARLVVIDILEKVRPPRKRNGSIYEEDYQATHNITKLAQQHNVAVLIVHHANKLNPADFRDAASGSMSLIGGADNLWSLDRKALQSDATLRITGRDIEQEQDLAMEFKDGFWSVLGEATDYYQSRERKEIVELLKTRPMTPMQIAEQLDKNRNTIRGLLVKLLAAGKIFQPYEGHYAARPDTEA